MTYCIRLLSERMWSFADTSGSHSPGIKNKNSIYSPGIYSTANNTITTTNYYSYIISSCCNSNITSSCCHTNINNSSLTSTTKIPFETSTYSNIIITNTTTRAISSRFITESINRIRTIRTFL